MAKSKKAKSEKKAAPAGQVRRITHRVLMDGHEEAAANGGVGYMVFGIAKKAIVQDTTFGRIPGLKGMFEAITPDGKKLTSKRCFLPVELHSDVAAKMTGEKGEEIVFGAHIGVKGEAVEATFFMAPAQADPMAQVREAAKSA